MRVNCVSPWYIGTELAMQVLKDDAFKAEVRPAAPAAPGCGRFPRADGGRAERNRFSGGPR